MINNIRFGSLTFPNNRFQAKNISNPAISAKENSDSVTFGNKSVIISELTNKAEMYFSEDFAQEFCSNVVQKIKKQDTLENLNNYIDNEGFRNNLEYAIPQILPNFQVDAVEDVVEGITNKLVEHPDKTFDEIQERIATVYQSYMAIKDN